MSALFRLVAPIALVLVFAADGRAADVPVSVQTAAACAPRASTGGVPPDALRLIGTQDVVAREVFGLRDLVVIGGGTGRGVELGQQFFVRRIAPVREGARIRAVDTVGWVRVVAVNQTTAIALVDVACDGLLRGDHLEPYATLALPPDVTRTDTSGEPDFSAPSRVLFGANERTTGGVGDFMLADVGQNRGAAAGTRFAIYRDVGVVGTRFAIYRDVTVAGLPLAAVGEAVVVSADAETSLIRLTRARDAIRSGDLLIPRRK